MLGPVEYDEVAFWSSPNSMGVTHSYCYELLISELSIAVLWQKRLARRPTVLIQCPVLESSDNGAQSYESG